MATKWPPNGPVSILHNGNKVLSFPNQQQSMAKKIVKERPGAYKEMHATNDIISVLVLPLEGYCRGYCQKTLLFEGDFLTF